MPTLGRRSREALATCSPNLQLVVKLVVQHYDLTVLVGHRSRAEQEAAFRAGHSKLRWPDSLHNRMPSAAVDIAPYPIDWRDLDRFYHLAGRVLGVADHLAIPLRWGGDWDGDRDFKDQTFHDLGHFEDLEFSRQPVGPIEERSVTA